ncbi:MAG TPA: ATP-binding cassette domain-containing protein [Burkholderiales bacterium]|nr:ATP-binding cassette domain-containing protein [Burkholderiales bacterium]
MMRDAVSATHAVKAQGLTKRYGQTLAVDALNLEIPAGGFFGLLGPNGSGKTSTIHMLSTLIRPTTGEAWVAGHDVRNDGLKVRAAIGVVFQESALDRTLSVVENLRFAGLLHNLSLAQIRERSEELLRLFGLTEKRDQAVGELSGGQRRALDIARGVIHQPRILFLDEPTIGLDVPNRRNIWQFIERLRAEHNMTVFLTTHYLEEAVDCDEVAFIKQGRSVKSGPPHDLIDGLGAYIIEIEAENLKELAQNLSSRLGPSYMDGDKACFRFTGRDLTALMLLQTELGDRVTGMRWRKPNLNDVFSWVNETEHWDRS